MQDGANGGIRRGLVARRTSGRDDWRGCGEAAIRIQPDPHRDVKLFGMFDARLDVPKAREPRAHGVKFGCDKVAAVPCVVPSEAEEFSVAPVIACRVGSRLSSRAAIFD